MTQADTHYADLMQKRYPQAPDLPEYLTVDSIYMALDSMTMTLKGRHKYVVHRRTAWDWYNATWAALGTKLTAHQFSLNVYGPKIEVQISLTVNII